jgi:alkylation response protein AidB-like acyl-CoA dehydrogenase
VRSGAPQHLPASDRARVEAAERLAAELLRSRSAQIASERRLPAELVGALSEELLFSLCVPASLGGPECHAETLVLVVEALAAGDPSAGWCAAIASTSSVLAGYLEPEAAREIFTGPGAVAGGVFAPRGRALVEGDGYRVSGRWSFASGCQHCSWLMGGCQVRAEGEVVRTPAGGPDVRLLLFPQGAAKIIDTWDVTGLEGTGSHDIEVRDLEVPATHSVSIITDRPRESGPLFRFPVFGLLSLGIASVALGIARRAVEEITSLAADKHPTLSARSLAQRSATQSALAEAEAQRGSARAFLLETVRDVWERAKEPGELGLHERARVRLAATHAVRSAVRAVDIAYHLGGGSSIYHSSPLQRLFRDAHVATQHMIVGDATLELVGRVLLDQGVDPSML